MSISRNTLYNLLGAVVPLATALATVPMYINLIGENRYGVLAISWLLLGYFGVFDLGLGRATAQRIAKLKGETLSKKAVAFWTALLINSAFGIFGGLLLWPVAHVFFVEQFKIDEVLRPEILSAIPWLMIALPMATVSGVLSGGLQGIEKFLLLNLVSAGGSIVFQIFPLAVAWGWGPSLSVLLPVAILSRSLTLVVLFYLCRKHIFMDSKVAFSRREAKNLLSFGGWVTVSSFISPIMVMVDRFVTGAILGAKAVTFYTVPYQLAERTTILPNALASSLFPHFVTLSPSDEKRVSENSLRALILIMTPLSVMAIIIAEPFLSLWISVGFAKESSTVAMLLFAGFWINGLARVPHAQLQAKGRPDIVAKCHLVEIVPYLTVLYFAVTHYGIVGAAFAFSTRLYVDFVLLAAFANILKDSLFLKISAMVFIFLSFFVDYFVGLAGLPWLVVVGVVLVSVCAWSLANSPIWIKSKLTQFLIRNLNRLGVR